MGNLDCHYHGGPCGLSANVANQVNLTCLLIFDISYLIITCMLLTQDICSHTFTDMHFVT